MKSTDKPSLIETVIASGANASYVRTIPKTQTKSGSGEMSLDLGWPPECAIPIAAGGKYPQMADANGVLNLLSAAVQQLQARFMGPYNADFATAIDGYPLNAIVSDTKAGQFWVSTVEDNTTAPGADGASWQSLFAGYATNEALKTETTNRTNADTNLQNQIDNRVLKTGDTMSGTLVIDGPSDGVAINSSSASNNSGDYNDATINFALTKRPGYTAMIGLREHVGQTLGIVLSTWDGSLWHEFDLIAQGENQGRMVSPAGVSALTSDLPLPVGQKIFTFTATVTDTQNIALPQAMSNVLFVTAQGGTDGKGAGMTNINSWTNSTVNVSVASYHTGAPQGATITQTFLVIAIP